MFVVNDKVKMEWNKDKWLEISLKNKKKKKFVMACKEYLSTNGVMIPVFFNSETAWVHEDEQGTFDFKELSQFVKDEGDESFPIMFEEYNPLYVVDDGVNEKNIQHYGLSKVQDDIVKRVEDLAPYSVVDEV